MKENDELAQATKELSDNFDRFIYLLQKKKKLCEEVAKLKNKVVRK